jgi:limonene-1,2-epoxide hydrolase
MIAGAAGLAVASLPRPAAAKSLSHEEKENLKLVTDFVKGWEAKHYDTEKEFSASIAPDASIRMQEDKPATQRDGAIAMMKGLYTAGGSIEVIVEDSFVGGPVVVQRRIDRVKMPGKDAHDYKVCGVFVVKKGKIVEWTDYLAP